MNQPIFLTPIFQERIWGGDNLRKLYHYEIPSDRTGECWAISAHPNGQSVVQSGIYKGKSLSQLWNEYPELFGHFESENFPLLTKILDANEDLSVQVHPDDSYARKFENGELGKTECWYIIDCAEGAEIIFGHHAQTREEFMQMIEDNQWDKLLKRNEIKPGDFFYVPSGTIHALCKGTIVLETQQSSDTTYRVYDYERIDKKGLKRDLHLDKAIDVTRVPHQGVKFEPEITELEGSLFTKFIEEKYFAVYKWDVHRRLELKQDHHFMLVSVINGDAELKVGEDIYSLTKGMHFILPYQTGEFIIEGQANFIVSHP
ncbi:mannose-6-phosphate isomerase, class I [Peribacillus frigoritolerans]|uniref:mannose-6-phosphate isomerase, class I n=1 Tax=Peribacillus frigoritolerans TaxID=450367 RepID=UPI002E20DD62|nr:mannose-6-phosphate isomerase, class I [Peribacillus frigoritolerans]MED3835001.1 mannose-6-phosphate isomerase, class I [Peribacillus frigoritolerans]MED3844534.1 mannose-6-phosphate isomerase, class I [Peribacillus frigoritolerans]